MFTSALSALAISACGNGAPPGTPTAVTYDSAGVRIVEYPSLPQTSGRWTVPDTPDLVIGTADDAHTAFGRVSGFAEGANSEIVVADAQAQEVRVFDADGTYRWTAGRRGSGPGEFTSLASIYWTGTDSLVAVNHFSRSLAVFGPDGEYERTVQLGQLSHAGYGSPIVRGVLANGNLVITAAQNFDPAGKMGYRRDQFLLLMYDPTGTSGTELGLFPDMELMIEDMQGRMIARPVEMGRSTLVTARDSAIIAAVTDRFEFRKYNSSGALIQIVRVAVPPRRVDGTIRSRYIAHALSRIDEEARDAARPAIESTTLPEVLPALADVQIDPDGNIWVKDFVLPDEAQPPTWWVFDGNGSIVASAALPPDLAQVRVGTRHILGLAFDSLRIARIQRHPIQRR